MEAALFVALATVTLGLIVAFGLHVRRTHRETRAQFTRGLHELSARLDDLARELADGVQRVREEGLRARILESLGGALDLDEILTRCVEAADSLPGVAAAAITVEIDGVAWAASIGLDQQKLDPVAGPPGTGVVRAVGLSYHYRDGSGAPGAMLSAVAVPIDSIGYRLGFLTVFGRSEEPPVAGAEFQTLEAIAQHAGPAIERARETSARPRPTADALTGLGNRQVLHETLALEVARAHRGRRKLAVCVLDVDDLRETNERLGPPTADALLAEIADLLRAAIRPADLVFRCGGDEFAVVLPDSGRIEAEATFARVQASVRRLPRPVGSAPSLSAGIAELKPDDDGVSLFERAERALRRAKEAGKGTAA